MTPQKRLFVAAYVANGGNATAAAKEAGYSEKTAYAQGSRLLKDAEVASAIAAGRADRVEKLELTAERIDRERARLGLYDARKMVTRDDSAPCGWRRLELHELDEDTGRALAAVKFKVAKVYHGEQAAAAAAEVGAEVPRGHEVLQVELGSVEYKFHNKNDALTAADKVLGRCKEKVEHEAGPGFAELVAEAMARRESAKKGGGK